MAHNAIYFPYINIPPNPWLFRMALYWDRLDSIVPYEYIAEPEQLAPGMRSLISSGLVGQIQPGMYANELASYYPGFVEHARKWLRNRNGDLGGLFSRIHIEKLDSFKDGELFSLKRDLEDVGVAVDDNYPWVKMPTPLADDFMAYLAAALGQVDELDAVPITNSNAMGVSLSPTPAAILRNALLEELLPIPADSAELTIDSVLAFKERYGQGASRLRDRLEQECGAIAALDPEASAYEFRQLRDRLQR
jgi:hypothetical protein